MMQAAQHDSAALRSSSHSAIMLGIESIIDQLSANN